ncbi:MAG: response regulator [Alphaproteobacteria bacterium]|nr:response regulator [Alphaproteobacteria bacterium]
MAPEPEAKVYVVDDDDAVRDSLEALLSAFGFEVEPFASGAAFLDACGAVGKGCVLLDIRMPRMDGMEVQERLHGLRPDLPVIMITGHGDVAMAVRAMKAGAVDFVEKPLREETLLQSVEAALRIARQSHRNQSLGASALGNVERLTPREREVLEQLVAGRPNKVIAHALACSPRTVEIHRARIMEKMGARSLPHLVRLALAAGIEPDLG